MRRGYSQRVRIAQAEEVEKAVYAMVLKARLGVWSRRTALIGLVTLNREIWINDPV